MRLFFAIALPPDVRSTLETLATDLGKCRWTPAEQLHLTLRFLGEVGEDRVAGLIEPPEIDLPRPTIRVRGVGVFGPPRRPRVLWTAIEPADGVRAIARELDQRAAAIGIAPDPRPFAPHVTLARFRAGDPERVKRFLTEHARLASAPFQVEEVVLYQSTLSHRGAVHDPIARLALGRSGAP